MSTETLSLKRPAPGMKREEAIRHLENARDEIIHLQNIINTMRPDVEAYRVLCLAITNLATQPSQTGAPSIAWQIDNYLNDIKEPESDDADA
jgi:hypothetical protein